jgi:hypothetical protein
LVELVIVETDEELLEELLGSSAEYKYHTGVDNWKIPGRYALSAAGYQLDDSR